MCQSFKHFPLQMPNTSSNKCGKCTLNVVFSASQRSFYAFNEILILFPTMILYNQVKWAEQQKILHRVKRDGIPTDPKFKEMWYLVSEFM